MSQALIKTKRILMQGIRIHPSNRANALILAESKRTGITPKRAAELLLEECTKRNITIEKIHA